MLRATLLDQLSGGGVLGGATFLFCEPLTTTPDGALWFAFVYYLSKYYELLDTVLQLLKSRSPPHFSCTSTTRSCC